MASIYGIEMLTKDEIDSMVYGINWNHTYGFYGPVIEKDGKYYITTRREDCNFDDFLECPEDELMQYYEVTKVIDKSTSIDEAKSLLTESYDNIEYAKTSYDIDEVNDYVKEVEHELKQEIGHININNDGTIDIYDLDGNIIVEHTTISKNEDTGSTAKYDLSDIESAKTPTETFNLTDKLDDNNKVVIEGYIKELTGNSKTEIKLDKSGFYVAEINGTRIVFDKDATLEKAIVKVNEELQTGKSMNPMKSLATNKVQQKANGSRIFIDVPSFESAIQTCSSAQGMVESAKSEYKPSSVLSGKLSEAYSSLISGQSPVTKLDGSVSMLSSLSKNISYSLKAYNNIDHNLGVIINSVINEIFSMNKYQDKDTENFYGSDYNERYQAIDDLINELSSKLDTLKAKYEEKYSGDKVWFEDNISRLIMGVGYAFRFVTFGKEQLDDVTKKDDGLAGIPTSCFLKTIDFIQENDVIPKIKSYASGTSWKESGLEDVYYLARPAQPSSHYSEYSFLSDYVAFQKRGEPAVHRGIAGDGYWEWSDNEVKLIKEHMLKQVSEFESMTKTVKNLDSGEDQQLSGLELCKYISKDIISDEEVISSTASQKANYEKYRKIMPYEAEMQGDTYLEYLTQDWSKINVFNYPELMGRAQYMSQSELALYFMYRGVSITDKVNPNVITGISNDDKAIGYLAAMDDLINQRHGLEEAVLRINEYKEWEAKGGLGGINAFLKSGVDGFNDGVDGFMRGVANVFDADGIRDYQDYRDMYMMCLLSTDKMSSDVDDVYNLLGLDDMNPQFKSVLRRNYSVFKSVGTMTIPTLASFIPYVGPVASKLLYGAYTLGSSTEAAMVMQMDQTGQTDAARAYLYGTVSALSQVAMNKFSGIVGLNGSIEIPAGLGEFATKMIQQGGRAVAGAYLDAVWRASILQQSIDLSKLSEDALDNAITGMLTAAVMNGITKVSFKLADGLVFNFSDKYNSYQEMMQDWQAQFNESKLGQKLAAIKAIGGNKYKQQQLKWDKTIVGKWLDEAGDLENKYGLMDLEAKNIIGQDLKPGQHLVFDAERMNYYIYDENTGNALSVPKNWLSTSEGTMNASINYQRLIQSNPNIEREINRFNQNIGDQAQIVGINEDGIATIKTIHGDILQYKIDILNSGNAYNEIEQSIIDYEQRFATDYQLSQLDKNERFTSVADRWLGGMDSKLTRDFAATLSNMEPTTANAVVGLLTDPKILSLYEQAEQDARNGLPNLSAYRAHTIPHVVDVVNSTIETAYSIAKATGVPLTDADIRALAVTAILHDTGMHTDLKQVHFINQDGQLVFKTVENNDPLLGPNQDGTAGLGVIPDNGNSTRENHAFMSGVNALALSDTIKEYFPDVDPVELALLDHSHSKSNSGMTNLSSPAKISQGIESLQSGIDAWNRIHPDNPIIIDGVEGETILGHFTKSGAITGISYDKSGGTLKIKQRDGTSLLKPGGIYVYEFDKDFFKDFGQKSMTLRLGDACTNNDDIGTNQAGKQMEIDPQKVVTNPVDIDNATYYDKSTKSDKPIAIKDPNTQEIIKYNWEEAAKQELKGSEFSIDGEKQKGGHEFVLGENNENYSTRVHTDRAGNKSLDVVVTVKDGNTLPCNSINMGLERKGELNSGGSDVLPEGRLVFRLPNDTKPEALSYYEKLCATATNGEEGRTIVVENYDGTVLFSGGETK